MRFLRLAFLPLLLLLMPGSLVADCTSSLCSDCEQSASGNRGICQSVAYSASCSCSVDVGSGFCLLSGQCQYTGGGAGGGGGTGGGGAGGGGGACQQLPGRWCPSECMSCEPIFF
jgi:hypothetical protein